MQEEKVALTRRRLSTESNYSNQSGMCKEFKEDKRKLRNIVRMCMDTDYLHKLDQEQNHKLKRNKATFK